MNDGRRDFDFLHGTWEIRNRRLTARLAASTEWEEFAATGECCAILDGIGNIDSFIAIWPDGAPFTGMSLRIFNPESGDWSIYWSDTRCCALQPPVVGRFADGVGVFRGDDLFAGRPIQVRFTWSAITPTSAKWEQAFSPDGGGAWETNWEMFFTRANPTDPTETQ